jgi:flavin reductase (DIM6/NTAB) family NADH-FMN oxidoreductase RutF
MDTPAGGDFAVRIAARPGHIRDMAVLNPSELAPRDVYRWLISCITPRPIAWVSTVSPDGATNLAPFSFFNGVTSNPPSVLFCPVNDRKGNPKDTLRNIEATGEFVVNICDFAHARAMNDSAALLPYGESEFEKFSIPQAASLTVRPPRVASAPVALECTLHQIVRVGAGPLGGNIVIGIVQRMHIDDRTLGADGFCDPAKLDTIGRMGGDYYTRTTDLFAVERPA